MLKFKLSIFFAFIFFGVSNHILAQNSRLEILFAKSAEIIKLKNIEVTKLIGDVAMKQDGTFLNCDSALFYGLENTFYMDFYILNSSICIFIRILFIF